MRIMSRKHLLEIKRHALLHGNIPEIKRINKIAKLNGIGF